MEGGGREGKRKADHVMSRVKTAMRSSASSIATGVRVCVATEEVKIHVLRLVVLEGELWESVLRSSH